MKQIKRLSVPGSVLDSEDGLYVLYSDHNKVVKSLEKKIDKLEADLTCEQMDRQELKDELEKYKRLKEALKETLDIGE